MLVSVHFIERHGVCSITMTLPKLKIITDSCRCCLFHLSDSVNAVKRLLPPKWG